MLKNANIEHILGEPSCLEGERILVPLALGPGDDAAILHAVGIAKGKHAEIILLHVLAPFYQVSPWMIPMVWQSRYMDELCREDARHSLMELGEQLIPKEQPWSIRIVEGNSFTRIIQTAKELHPTLMVLTPPHTYSLASRLLFGSLRRRLLLASPCRVEVAA